MIDPEQKRKTIEKWTKIGVWGGGLLAVGLLKTLIFSALEGVILLGALGVAVGVIWSVAPALAVWFANKRIQALVAVIEANPIETMTNLYIEKQQEFKQQEDAVTEFDAQFRNVSDLIEGLKRTDPEEAKGYVQMRDVMEEGLKELRGEQAEAQKELKNAKSAIDKMKRLWTVACALNKALAASASAQQKVFQQIKQDVAVDTVRTNLNKAFANLNTAVERRRNASLFNTTATKDVTTLPEKAQKDLGPSVIDLERVKVKN